MSSLTPNSDLLANILAGNIPDPIVVTAERTLESLGNRLTQVYGANPEEADSINRGVDEMLKMSGSPAAAAAVWTGLEDFMGRVSRDRSGVMKIAEFLEECIRRNQVPTPVTFTQEQFEKIRSFASKFKATPVRGDDGQLVFHFPEGCGPEDIEAPMEHIQEFLKSLIADPAFAVMEPVHPNDIDSEFERHDEEPDHHDDDDDDDLGYRHVSSRSLLPIEICGILELHDVDLDILQERFTVFFPMKVEFSDFYIQDYHVLTQVDLDGFEHDFGIGICVNVDSGSFTEMVKLYGTEFYRSGPCVEISGDLFDEIAETTNTVDAISAGENPDIIAVTFLRVA